MNTILTNHNEIDLFEESITSQIISTDKPFIVANTIKSSLEIIKYKHVIPVFTKDNEPVISHSNFIEITYDAVFKIFDTETILKPSVRLSHEIKGRVPEARQKPANQLLEYEKTIYFERMAFIIEIPSIHAEVGGNTLSLTVGGIKAYNLDNLYNKKGADQHFKVFIGFQNKVCCNLGVWTDGFLSDLKVQSIGQLKACITTLIEKYNAVYHLHFLRKLNDYVLTENQFAPFNR